MVKQNKKGSKTMSLHIAVDNKAPVAKTVLMPGDPLRAQFIAENFLTEPVRYSEIRNMYGYTGTYKGVQVSVQGSIPGNSSHSTTLRTLSELARPAALQRTSVLARSWSAWQHPQIPTISIYSISTAATRLPAATSCFRR